MPWEEMRETVCAPAPPPQPGQARGAQSDLLVLRHPGAGSCVERLLGLHRRSGLRLLGPEGGQAGPA